MRYQTGMFLAALAVVGFIGCGDDKAASGAPGGDGSGASSSGGGTGGAVGTGATGPLITTGGSGGTGTGGAGADSAINTITTEDGILVGRVRDFHRAHPDMEPAESGKCDDCDDRGMVADTIGDDSKPVYIGPEEGTLTTNGPGFFNEWYRDVDGVNTPIALELQFVDPDGDGVWTYDNQEFFPIDNMGFGHEGPDLNHNFHFTFELHTLFTYQGGEVFTFTGDDDVFTYINGALVVDLGGIHPAQSVSVELDSLGLVTGDEYQLDFFFAERHITESHFRIDTTITFTDSIILPR